MVFNPFRRFGAIQYAPLSTFQTWMPTVKADELIKGPRRRIWLAVLLISFALFVTFITSLRLASLPPLAPKAPDHQVVNTPILSPDPWPLYLPAIPNFHLPEVARYNTPALHRPRTPLFIGFTRNRFLLQQTVLSYIAAGWPRTDIIVVDNSGTLDANERSLLSDDNPFQLDYHLLRSRYGVSILQVPTLLNFAQLQNFFLRTALSEGWDYYFWSHMDIAVLSYEDRIPYRSFYDLTLGFLRDTNITNGDEGNWAIKFFDYDHLTLINVHAWRKIGQWDTFIPYYATDCDAYSRVRLHGYVIEEVRAGHIFDIAATVSDLESKFFPPPSEINTAEDPNQQPNSSRYQSLVAELQKLKDEKYELSDARNTWQDEQKAGRGQAWTYDPAGFQKAWWSAADHGRAVVYPEKWGTGECDLGGAGKTLKDLWTNA